MATASLATLAVSPLELDEKLAGEVLVKMPPTGVVAPASLKA
jgi:hypothetical protein